MYIDGSTLVYIYIYIYLSIIYSCVVLLVVLFALAVFSDELVLYVRLLYKLDVYMFEVSCYNISHMHNNKHRRNHKANINGH